MSVDPCDHWSNYQALFPCMWYWKQSILGHFSLVPGSLLWGVSLGRRLGSIIWVWDEDYDAIQRDYRSHIIPPPPQQGFSQVAMQINSFYLHTATFQSSHPCSQVKNHWFNIISHGHWAVKLWHEYNYWSDLFIPEHREGVHRRIAANRGVL